MISNHSILADGYFDRYAYQIFILSEEINIRISLRYSAHFDILSKSVKDMVAVSLYNNLQAAGCKKAEKVQQL